MTLNDAVALRTKRLLKERDMTVYRLERNSGLIHGAVNRILDGKNKTVTLTTVFKIARAFNMTAQQFLDDEIFYSEDLEID